MLLDIKWECSPAPKDIQLVETHLHNLHQRQVLWDHDNYSLLNACFDKSSKAAKYQALSEVLKKLGGTPRFAPLTDNSYRVIIKSCEPKEGKLHLTTTFKAVNGGLPLDFIGMYNRQLQDLYTDEETRNREQLAFQGRILGLALDVYDYGAGHHTSMVTYQTGDNPSHYATYAQRLSGEGEGKSDEINCRRVQALINITITLGKATHSMSFTAPEINPNATQTITYPRELHTKLRRILIPFRPTEQMPFQYAALLIKRLLKKIVPPTEIITDTMLAKLCSAFSSDVQAIEQFANRNAELPETLTDKMLGELLTRIDAEAKAHASRVKYFGRVFGFGSRTPTPPPPTLLSPPCTPSGGSNGAFQFPPSRNPSNSSSNPDLRSLATLAEEKVSPSLDDEKTLLSPPQSPPPCSDRADSMALTKDARVFLSVSDALASHVAATHSEAALEQTLPDMVLTPIP
jgi:hypothetical protein